jgi:predicted amidohydrolase
VFLGRGGSGWWWLVASLAAVNPGLARTGVARGTALAPAATLGGQGGRITFSENPVRGASVFINYPGAATRVAIYSFDGSLIQVFTAPPASRQAWDLTDASGRAVANGVYLVVVTTATETLRRRLYVARRTGP